MSRRGVFAVDRSIWEHDFFRAEPFTGREAWMWLVSEAAWKACRKKRGGVMVDLSRGQLAHSIRFLADRWGWHRARVARFLNRLKTETMVETRSETGVTLITVCKYDDYQRVSLPSETFSKTAPATT